MAEHRAVGLVARRAPPLSPNGVGLGEVEHDDAVGVAGRDLLVGAGEQLEREAALALAPGLDRQPEKEFSWPVGDLTRMPPRSST